MGWRVGAKGPTWYVCVHACARGAPLGSSGGWGAGGRTTAGYTVDYRKKSAFLHMQNLLQPSVLFLSLLGNACPSPPPPLFKRNTTWHMRLTYQGQLNTYFSCLLSWRLISVPFYFLVKYIIYKKLITLKHCFFLLQNFC
jgi:hypothetical protein